MADKVKIWFDREGDYLEVQFKEALGYMKETRTMPSSNASTPTETLSALAFSELAASRKNNRWKLS